LLTDQAWEALGAALGGRRGRIWEIATAIHAHPEEGWKEFRAAAWLTQFLQAEGFTVRQPVAGLPTAFTAEWGAGGKKPSVAYLAEYDALPELGHACGHNLIAAAAVGAAAALRQVMADTGTGGRVLVLGTPAEETGGGKLRLLDAGLFQGIDAAFMMHPAGRNRVGGGSLALTPVRLVFRGRAAHAAASPQEGVNALDAVIQTFNAANALRQHLPEDVRLHGIVTRGGVAPNIVPDLAEAYYYVRAATASGVRHALGRLVDCARAGAVATGASLEVIEEDSYLEIIPNPPLEKELSELLVRAGVELADPDPDGGLRGSTDFGNVTRAVPAASFTLAICPPTIAVHSRDFAAAAISPEAELAVWRASLAMAAVGLKVLGDPALLGAARVAWKERMVHSPAE